MAGAGAVSFAGVAFVGAALAGAADLVACLDAIFFEFLERFKDALFEGTKGFGSRFSGGSSLSKLVWKN